MVNTINRNQFVFVVIPDNGNNTVFIVLFNFSSKYNTFATWASCDAFFIANWASCDAFFLATWASCATWTSCAAFSLFSCATFCFALFASTSASFICWVNLFISSDTDAIFFIVSCIFVSVLTNLDCKSCVSSSICLL